MSLKFDSITELWPPFTATDLRAKKRSIEPFNNNPGNATNTTKAYQGDRQMLKKMTVGKQIFFGFGLILCMLLIIGITSYAGVSGIVSNAVSMITGERIIGEMKAKEIDHQDRGNNQGINEDHQV